MNHEGRQGIDPEEIRQIEKFLDSIPEEMHQKDLNVLQRVVEILTSKSRNQQIHSMQQQLQKVEHILGKIVDDSYQPLLDSIHSYSHIVDKVQLNKAQVSTLHSELKASKTKLKQDVSHLASQWRLAKQYREMHQLLDCISWLKTVPSTLECYFPNLEQTLQQSTVSLLQGLHNNNVISTNENILESKSSVRAYLHSSFLIISAAMLLKSKEPIIQNGKMPILTSNLRTLDKQTISSDPPLEYIPALKGLSSFCIQLYEVFFIF